MAGSGQTSVRGRVRHRLPMLVPVVRSGRAARRRARMLTTDRVRYFRTAGPDRLALERGVFPALQARPDMQRILFVGTEWYTRTYPDLFADREFWTLDVDPQVARYGAPDRHVVASIEAVADHFTPQSLDAIVCHGVFGAWLEDKDRLEKVFADCFDLVRPGGLFILGWSAREEITPHPPDTIASLERFDRFVLENFTANRHPTFGDWRVMIDFYRRPD